MAKTQEHRVWEVRIGSLDDEKLGDRFHEGGQRFVMAFKLPERAVYLVEAKGQGTNAVKKALKLAIENGIPNPVSLGYSLVNFRDAP